MVSLSEFKRNRIIFVFRLLSVQDCETSPLLITLVGVLLGTVGRPGDPVNW